jgi:hypothetical protein
LLIERSEPLLEVLDGQEVVIENDLIDTVLEALLRDPFAMLLRPLQVASTLRSEPVVPYGLDRGERGVGDLER